ncbi:hypothetical protein AMS68_001434 [Peltaster fructicola]|uniref:Uncharacterized protein n=1 Tax=Peltaster fructicola TaxID=286661 RepID=A0A6H0XME0_9PEZI|nr:hypothetical protein AMS68_001434 [Peltaster fructicola]
MSAKRAHDFNDSDDGAKRIRSNTGSPVPARAAPAEAVSEAKQNAADRIAALQAKLAAAKKRAGNDVSAPAVQKAPIQPAAATAQPEASSIEQRRAQAMKQIAELKARSASNRQGVAIPTINGNDAPPARATGAQSALAAAKAQAAKLTSGQTRSSAPSSSPASVNTHEQVANDLQRRIQEARARAAEAKAQREKPSTPVAQQRHEDIGPRGGLGIGLHPALYSIQDHAGGAKRGAKAGVEDKLEEPKEKVNPYLPAENEAPVRIDETVYDPKIARKSGNRTSKPLAFVAQGKYIAQSIALKEQAELEAMKRRIALESKKIAIESASDRSFLVPEPPEIEWWDDGLLTENHKSYDDWEQHNRIEAADSTITAYVQHPVLLAAPQDKLMPAPKALMLTTKEMKKLRRQRRMADMKEEQAKIRLGLIDAPAPKVKKGNMMRVYGEQAVKDPTAVEARVNKEIAQRAETHEQDNAARKLTKEQRAEKLKRQQAGDEAKGIKIAVFRVDNLSSGKHRFQVDINAKQHALHGIVILHPDMNLIIVEGGVHSVTAYKKLLLNRIKWAENTLPLSNNSNATFTAAASRNVNRDLAEGPSAIDTWLNPLTDAGELKDLSENRCLLVWEGDERQYSFRKWGSRVCETDGEARDTLARSKMENMWELAKGTTE